MLEKMQYVPNILIVTIDPDISNLIEVLLNNLNYKIQLINSGTEVIEQLRKKDFDLMLIDVNLPDMNVIQVISYAVSHSPDIQVIVLSTDVSSEKTIECLNSGAYDYIRKPYNKEEILRRVGNAIDQEKLKKEMEILSNKFEVMEQQYQYVVQNSHDIVYSLDIDGNFTFINDSAKQILGCDSHDLLGKHYSTVIYPEYMEKAKYKFNERRSVSRGKEYVRLRLKTLEGDDTRIWPKRVTVELKAKGIYDKSVKKNGDVFVGTYGVARDISGHIEKEELLKLLRAYFQQLFNNSPDAIAIMDNHSRVIDVNQSFEELFKFSNKELRFKDIHDFIVPHELYEEAKSVSEEVLTNGSVHKESVRSRKDGSRVNVSIIGYPIQFGSEQIGMYGIYRDLTRLKHSEKELQSNLEKLRKAMGGIIHAMVSTVEVRDPYTAGHQQRVANLARAIAQEMELPKEEVEGIRMASTLHDLGKVNIPAEILSKPGRLTDIEFSLIKMHPEIAYEILKKIDFSWPIAEIVYQHHERIDGSGYPRGLRGKDIPLAARILTVADVVEAIASHRPYRPALGMKKALNEISKNGGIFYDRDVVDACLRLFTKKKFIFNREESDIQEPFFQ